MIRKSKAGYTVVSHTSGRKFGTYRSKAAAKKRLAQVKMFKYMKRRKPR